MQVYRPSEFNSLCFDLDIQVVKQLDLERLILTMQLQHRHFISRVSAYFLANLFLLFEVILRRLSVFNQQTFDSVLLDEDVDSGWGHAHHDCVDLSVLLRLKFEVLESIELNTRLRS